MEDDDNNSNSISINGTRATGEEDINDDTTTIIEGRGPFAEIMYKLVHLTPFNSDGWFLFIGTSVRTNCMVLHLALSSFDSSFIQTHRLSHTHTHILHVGTSF